MQLAMEKTGTFVHACQSQVTIANQGTHIRGGEDGSIITHHGSDLVLTKFHLHLHTGDGTDVLADVSEGFLDNAKDRQLEIRR